MAQRMRYEVLTGLECGVDSGSTMIRDDAIRLELNWSWGREVDKCQRTDWTTKQSKPAGAEQRATERHSKLYCLHTSIYRFERLREREREGVRWPGQRPVVASLSKSYGTLSFRFINQKQKQPKQNLAQSSCVSFGKHQIDRSKGERREWGGGSYCRTGSFVDLCRSSFCFWGLLFMFFFTLHR